VITSTGRLKTNFVNLAAVSQIFEGLSNAVSKLHGTFADLTAAYSVQAAAAQELSTYLGLSSSLKTIIPTMNDMIVQQLGMNASADSAVQIATMLGKVINGQTKALSRYGYEFSEALEYILQFGDETERAAVLCKVIGQSVGGMNEKFAQTDVGRQKQMADAIGKIKEEIGGLVVGIEPWINGLAEAGKTVSNIIKLKSAFEALAETELIVAANAKVQTAAQKILEAAGYSAADGTTALRIEHSRKGLRGRLLTDCHRNEIAFNLRSNEDFCP